MSALEAAYIYLSSLGKPAGYRKITEGILAEGLWETAGKTPDDTVSARLSVDIKRHGESSRFQRVGRGVYALREWGLADVAASAKASTVPDPAPDKPSGQTMSFTDAAEHVLDRHASKRPMHYRAVTERILADGLVQTKGKTPEATLYAQVLSEIKRKTRRGEANRFVRHGKGYIGLRRWMGRGLAFQIERHNADIRKRLLAELRQLDPGDFEALIARLLAALGFEEVEVTKLSADGGIDVRGILVVGEAIRTRMAVQVKRWKGNIQSPTVQQVRGSLGAHEQGLIITTSGFSKGAAIEAERADATPVGLMDGDRLVTLLVENDIGVSRTPHELLELAPLDESEMNG